MSNFMLKIIKQWTLQSFMLLALTMWQTLPTNGHRRTCLALKGHLNDRYSSKLSLNINKQFIRGKRKLCSKKCLY